jgi:hypothetical protein
MIHIIPNLTLSNISNIMFTLIIAVLLEHVQEGTNDSYLYEMKIKFRTLAANKVNPIEYQCFALSLIILY